MHVHEHITHPAHPTCTSSMHAHISHKSGTPHTSRGPCACHTCCAHAHIAHFTHTTRTTHRVHAHTPYKPHKNTPCHACTSCKAKIQRPALCCQDRCPPCEWSCRCKPRDCPVHAQSRTRLGPMFHPFHIRHRQSILNNTGCDNNLEGQGCRADGREAWSSSSTHCRTRDTMPGVQCRL